MRKYLLTAIAILIACVMVVGGVTVYFEKPQVQNPTQHSTAKIIDGIPTLRIGLASDVEAAPSLDYVVVGNADSYAQSALNALPITGGRLEFMPGTYTFGSTVSRAINNVMITGQGKSTIFNYNGSTAIFSAGSQSGWIFRDFVTDAGGITLTSAANYRLEDVTIGTTYYPASVRTSLVVASSDATTLEKSQADYVCDGTNDEVQINAAIAALGAKGGTIHFTAGLFSIGAGLDITTPGIHLEGTAGGDAFDYVLDAYLPKGTTFITYSGLSYLMKITASDVYISNIMLYGANLTNIGLWLSDAKDCRFENLSINRVLQKGVYLQATSDLCANNQFTNLQIYMPNDAGAAQSDMRGIVFDGSPTMTNATVNKFYNVNIVIKGVATSYGVDFYEYTDNNTFYGLQISSISSSLTSGVIFNSHDPTHGNFVCGNQIFNYLYESGGGAIVICNYTYAISYAIPNRIYGILDPNGSITIQNSGLLEVYGSPYDVPMLRSYGKFAAKTIASGSITITNNFELVDTEGGASSDDLTTILGGRNGMILVLEAANDAHTVVVKNGAGNISLAGSDFSLDNKLDTLTLMWNDSYGWIEIARSNNGS